jgi:hypothetical protein
VFDSYDPSTLLISCMSISLKGFSLENRAKAPEKMHIGPEK